MLIEVEVDVWGAGVAVDRDVLLLGNLLEAEFDVLLDVLLQTNVLQHQNGAS